MQSVSQNVWWFL